MTCIFSEYPQLCVKVKVASQKSHDEHFSLVVRGNVAQIEAASPFAASYAKAQLLAGLQANRLGDFVGNNAPQFNLRSLWLDSLDGVSFTELIDLGYNTLIFPFSCLDHQLTEQIKKCGIKIAIHCASLHEVEHLQGVQGACDYVLWQQGTLCYRGSKKDPTPFEQAEYEVQMLEKACPLPFFYYAKPRCPFLLKISRAVPHTCAVLFDAIHGMEISGVFTELSQMPFEDETRLVPMLKVGQIAQPDNSLFSDFGLATIENVLGRQKKQRFIGAACRVGALSQAAQIAQMPLWVIGQRMWRNIHSQSLFEVWLHRYHPEWSPWLVPELLQLIHALFRCKDELNIEKAAIVLVQVAEMLTEHKKSLRFQGPTKSLEELSMLLLQLQQAFKGYFETLCAQKMLKIPLSLQNFTPVAFLCCAKINLSVK